MDPGETRWEKDQRLFGIAECLPILLLIGPIQIKMLRCQKRDKEASQRGRSSRDGIPGVAALTPEAQAKRSETQRRHASAILTWKASDQPAWLDHEAYLTRIQPLLAGLTRSTTVAALGVSVPCAAKIRIGDSHPASQPLVGARKTRWCFQRRVKLIKRLLML